LEIVTDHINAEEWITKYYSDLQLLEEQLKTKLEMNKQHGAGGFGDSTSSYFYRDKE
jgi:hypothetical protein